ncbi:MAG: hypothetical protein AB4911_19465 [Oscillochloridaceae bacterium umkhey_bin13]
MKMLPFTIYLEQPVLLARSTGDTNSLVSLDYLPGSAIRGMLIGRYLRTAGTTDDLAADPTARRLFFDGGVRYLNAYRCSATGQRSLPTPLALLKRKLALPAEGSYHSYNAAHEDWNDERRRELEQNNDQLQRLGIAYCTINDAAELHPVTLEPNRIAVHVQRNRELGRAVGDNTENGGTIFKYEALAEDQTFAGVIMLDDEADLATIQALCTPAEAWLGRSRSANYGRVRLNLGKPQSAQAWREVPNAPELEAVEAGQMLQICFLSDTLLRDGQGVALARLSAQPSIKDQDKGHLIDDQYLSAYLGFAVRIDPARSFSAATVAGGFNQTWRLPLPQQAALKAGSVFVVYPHKAVSRERLAQLEQTGIGERRAEGFGRIAFQWLEADEYVIPQSDHTRPKREIRRSETLTPNSQIMATRMAQRLLDQQIEQKITSHVLNLTDSNRIAPKDLPRNSQLGRLRGAVRYAQQTNDLTSLRTLLRDLKTTAHDQFARARIGNRTMLDWCNAQLEPGAIWEELGLMPDNWPQVATIKPNDAPQLATQTTLRLLDAVLTALHRKKKERDDQ